MGNARLLLLIVGLGFLLFIVRQLVRSWLSGPDRDREYRQIDSEERAIEREAGSDIPKCPICGGGTKLHRYPHIMVWRCLNYPDCRGYVKARKPSRPKFAEDWDRKVKKKRN